MNIEIWHVSGDGFHFGRHGLEQEKSGVHMPSDSLFAAVVARMAELFGDEVVAAFGASFLNGDPPFVMSSAFPRAGEVLFFPPPLRRRAPLEAEARPKDLKQVQFVSEGVFRKLLGGEALAGMWKTTCKLHDEKVLLTPEELATLPEPVRTGEQPIWKVERRPQVTIGRAASDSMLYHTGRTAFNEGCGLWFGLRWLDKQAQVAEQLGTALLELGDAGLGGERSRGFGKCKIEAKGKLDLPAAAGEDHWVSLSRYLPKDQAETRALLDGNAAYAIETVQGWVTSPEKAAERRRAINMLSEGSVLGEVATETPGQMVDVRPDYGGQPQLNHPVWRNGFALAVGIQGGQS